LPLLLKCGSFLPRTKSKSGQCGKPLGKNCKKGKKLPLFADFLGEPLPHVGQSLAGPG
jgi:hypothetical protein